MEQLAGIRTVMGSDGVTFDNAFVTYSLCCPSRASILRGQYGHNHDITGNSDPQGGWPKFRSLGHENSTIATWLDDAGYQTKYIGVYMTGYYYSNYRPPGWDEWYTLIGDPTLGNVNDNGTKTTLVGHSTDVFADKASDFIRRSSSNSEPFFAMIGTRAPHFPPPVADRYNDRFATASLPRSSNFDEMDISDKLQWVQSYGRLTSGSITEMQDQYRNRLRSMLSVEDLLRQTIATLQETGELSNTYIFLTSDNGFHMGNHRLYPGGKWTPYEEDIGVPLMVRGPGVPAGATREHLVINSDFAPTIADLAGAPIPAFVDGRSFAPLLGATPPPPSNWRHRFLQEGWMDHETETNPDIPKVPTHQGVHTQRYMYVEYNTGEKELYDLSADPYQLSSLPRTGNESTYSELGSRLAKLRDCVGEACRVAEQEELDTTAPTVSSVSPADQTQNDSSTHSAE
jgi:arylsulfatase A-like enzyme